jgi:hypothetical protein
LVRLPAGRKRSKRGGRKGIAEDAKPIAACPEPSRPLRRPQRPLRWNVYFYTRDRAEVVLTPHLPQSTAVSIINAFAIYSESTAELLLQVETRVGPAGRRPIYPRNMRSESGNYLTMPIAVAIRVKA